jgi:hypothetical protein
MPPNTPAINFNPMFGKTGEVAAAQSRRRPAASASEVLELSCDDQNFAARVQSSGPIKAINLAALPTGVKLAMALDQTGFCFFLQVGGSGQQRHYFPDGLKEIRVNGQCIDVELERKWLLHAYVNQSGRNFASLDNSFNSRQLLSYYCGLAQLPADKLEALVSVMGRTASFSSDPFFVIYLVDLSMAKLVRSLISKKFKARGPAISQNDAVRLVEDLIGFLEDAFVDCNEAVRNLNCIIPSDGVAPLAAVPLRANPRAYWTSAYCQIASRRALVKDCLDKLRAEKLLSLLPVPELLLVLAGGNSNLGLKDFLDETAAN